METGKRLVVRQNNKFYYTTCSETISWGLRTDITQSGGVPPRGIDSWIKNNVEDTNGLTMHVCEFEGQQKVDLDVIGHGIMGEKESECMWTVSERDPGLLYVHK